MTLTMNCPTESCITWNLQNFKYLSFQQVNICNDFGDLSSNSGGVWSYQGKKWLHIMKRGKNLPHPLLHLKVSHC